MDFSRREDNSDPNWQKRQNTLTNYFQVRRAPQGLVVQKTYQQDGNKDPKEGQMYFPVSGLSIQDLMKTGRSKVVVNDKELALVAHKGTVYAIQEKCPHAGGPLYLGDIEDVPGCGPCIKCPWHKWTFSLKTGDQIFPPRDPVESMETFPVQLSGGAVIKVGFREISPQIFSTPPE